MIRIIASSEVSPNALGALDTPLPDFAGQPLLLHDQPAACADWLAALSAQIPLDGLGQHAWLGCVASPAGIERSFRDDAVMVSERIVVAPTRNAAIIEWRADGGAALDLAWTYAGADEIAFIFSTPVEATTLDSHAGAETSAHLSIPESGVVRLLVTQRISELGELDPQLWLRTHAAQTQRRRNELLRFETSDARRDTQWEWWVFLQSLGWQPAGEQIREYQEQLLGIDADPERGRLVLRPRIPRDCAALTVHNIRVDDALIRLTYEARDDGCTFSIVQTAGAYPIRLILEPLLLQKPRNAFVDGKPAALNLRIQDAGVIAPVQIMLDEQRVVGFAF